MTPNLSDEAWALLSALHRAGHGGPPPPDGWVATYDQLHSLDLVVFVGTGRYQITAAGVHALEEHFLKG